MSRDSSSSPALSPPLTAAVDALLQQSPAAPEVYAQLTAEERADLRTLARTAALAQASLLHPDDAPTASGEAEQKSLETARRALARTSAGVSPSARVSVAEPALSEADANRRWWQFWRR